MSAGGTDFILAGKILHKFKQSLFASRKNACFKNSSRMLLVPSDFGHNVSFVHN